MKTAAEVKIFFLDLNSLSTSGLLPMLHQLSPTELVRYHGFARELRRSQFLAGRLILRYAVAQTLGRPAADIVLLERPNLGPLLLIGGQPHDCGFSISHSANWVACACSATAKLGLDIELRDPRRNVCALAARSFDPQDLHWFSTQPDQVAAFYQLWSRKEARFKLQQNHSKPVIEYGMEVAHPTVSVVVMADREISVGTVQLKYQGAGRISEA